MNTLYYITREMVSVYEAEADPNASADSADPNASANSADPNASANSADPNASANSADPFADNGNNNDDQLDPIKKYILYNKLVELKHYISMYLINSQSANLVESEKLLRFVSIVIDFYETFDYATIKSLVKSIIEKTNTLVKSNTKKEKRN